MGTEPMLSLSDRTSVNLSHVNEAAQDIRIHVYRGL